MKIDDLADDVGAYLKQMTGSVAGVREIWLFGSRANSSSTNTSDWDFFVFGDRNVLAALQSEPRPPKDIDILIVYDGENFAGPWRRESDGWEKTGNLKEWKWRQVRSDLSEYSAKKDVQGSIFPSTKELKAIRIYP